MSNPIYNLAFDFGASSGRMILAKTEDGKIKNFKKEDIEMVDGDVHIDIEIQDPNVYQEQSDYNVDIKQLEDDRNSSTGNV